MLNHRQNRKGRRGKTPVPGQFSILLGEGTVTSYSPKVDITKEFGRTLSDIPMIEKEHSVWYIDESGVPAPWDYRPYFVITAITELSPIDYVQLYKGIPLVQDKHGNSLVHFAKLLEYDQKNYTGYASEICERIGLWGDNNSLLILQYPIDKHELINLTSNKIYWHSMNTIIKAIKEIDHSKRIEIVSDRITPLEQNTRYSSIPIETLPSYESRKLWTSDIAASSLGKGLNPSVTNKEPNPDYFNKGIRKLSVNTSELVVEDTQSLALSDQLRQLRITQNKNKKHSVTNNHKPKPFTEKFKR